MLKNYTLRLAQESDAAALLKIYAPFVESEPLFGQYCDQMSF